MTPNWEFKAESTAMMGATKRIGRCNRRTVLAGALMMTTALATTVAVSQARAQQATASPPTIAQLQSERSFDIPAQPLTDALVAFGQQSGVQVTVNGTVARDVSAPAVRGTMTSEQALRQLLAGSGLIYTMSGSTVAIERPGQSADGAIVLDPVTVEGATLRDPGQTEGTNSYTSSISSVGSKTPTSIRETPQSVSVVTRKRIEDRDFTTVREALDETTGVRVQVIDDTRATFFSRGYQASILQDGVQVPRGTQFESAPDLAFYDRVEVLRGPAGLFNGAGEPGGSINLVRKRPLDEFQVSGIGRVGSWDHYRGDVDVTGPLVESERIRGRFVAAYEDREWFVDTYEATKGSVYGTVEMDLTPDTILSVGVMHQDYDHSDFNGLPAFYTDGTRVDLARNTYICPDWCNLDTRNTDAFFELEHRFDNGVEAKASGRFIERTVDGKRGYVNSAINPATGNVNMLGAVWDVTQEDYTFDSYVSAPVEAFGQEQRFLLGADYKFGTNNNRTGFAAMPAMNAFTPNHSAPEPVIPVTSHLRTKTEELGTYGQARLKPGLDWLTVVLGGRLTWWNSNVENVFTNITTTDTSANEQFTPYAGLVFDLTDQISTYGSYTAIFQPQTAQTPAGGVVPPREGEQYELGVKGEFLEGRLLTHLAGFWLEDVNRATTINGCVGAMCSEAAGVVRSRGIEAEVSGEPVPGWNILAGYAYNYSTYVDDPNNQGDVYSTWTPKHQINLSTQYSFQNGSLQGFSIGGGMRFTTSVFEDLAAPYGRLEQDAVAVFNANVGYTFSENFAAQLTVNNLFDEEYYSGLGTQSRGNHWGEPRSVMFSLRGTW